MAVRFYLPNTGAAAVSPTFNAEWDFTTGADRIALVRTRIASTMTSKGVTDSTATANRDALARQYVSEVLPAQTISGTLKGQVRAFEGAVASNLAAQVIASVVSGDGLTVRGVLYAGNLATGTTNPTSEFGTSLANRQFPTGTGGVTLTSQSASAGDRIVIEIGYRKHAAASTTGTLSFGDDSATDLAEDETTTTANNPWVEFSQDLFTSAVPLTESGAVAATDVLTPAGTVPLSDSAAVAATDTVSLAAAIGALGPVPLALATLSGTLSGQNAGGAMTATATGALRYQTGPWTGTQAALVEAATTNLAKNASGESSPYVTGTAIQSLGTGTTLTPDATTGVTHGTQAIKVVTPGTGTREGVRSYNDSQSMVGGTLIGACDVTGSGTVTVSLVAFYSDSSTTESALTTVTLTATPQRAAVAALTLNGAKTLTRALLDVRTVGTQATTFWVDSLQIEAATFLTTYTDGSLGTGYAWTGTANNSSSTRAATTLTIPYTGTLGALSLMYSEDFGTTWQYVYRAAAIAGAIGSFGTVTDSGTSITIGSSRSLVVGPVRIEAGALTAAQQTTLSTATTEWTWQQLDALADAGLVIATESLSIAASTSVILTESGAVAATDVLGIAITTPVALTESGTVAASEALTNTSSVTLTEAGTVAGADGLAVTTAMPLTDGGAVAATEALGVTTATPLTDSGTVAASDVLSAAITVPVALTDSGPVAATETLALTSSTTLTDAGTVAASETLAPVTDIPLTDGGTVVASETLAPVAATPLTDTGAVVATEGLAVVAPVALTDSGIVGATETADVAATVPLADTALVAATDELSGTAATPLIETGVVAASEALTIAPAVPLTDTGAVAATDVLTIATITPVALTDTGTVAATDALDVTASVAGLADSGTIAATDILDIAPAVPFAESGPVGATDALSLAAAAPFAESGVVGASEGLVILVTIDVTDTGTVTVADALAVRIGIPLVPVRTYAAGRAEPSFAAADTTRAYDAHDPTRSIT